jgi:predicted transcriptional regulator of viral defense system
MKFEELLQAVGEEPVFETGILLAGDVDPAELRVQLSRWTRAGKLIQLRRGLYALAPPYQKTRPHPFLVANRLAASSYVSRESALSFHGLIPEYVAQITSVTTGRPRSVDTKLGSFDFRHVRSMFFSGFLRIDLPDGQDAFIASPEKSILDLIYLREGVDLSAFLEELRLQNLDRLDLPKLLELAQRSNSPRLKKAAQMVAGLAASESQEMMAL